MIRELLRISTIQDTVSKRRASTVKGITREGTVEAKEATRDSSSNREGIKDMIIEMREEVESSMMVEVEEGVVAMAVIEVVVEGEEDMGVNRLVVKVGTVEVMDLFFVLIVRFLFCRSLFLLCCSLHQLQ